MHAYRSAEKDGAWLTMREAAAKLGATSHVIRRMILDGVLPAEQVVQDAPWQIQAKDLEAEPVLASRAEAARVTRLRRGNFQYLRIFEEES